MSVLSRHRSWADASKALLGGVPKVAPTFVVVALLACVLVPLPTELVDLLLSASLASAVLLLVASLTIRKSSEFITFPSLLLLATLFRLSLNISTTRLILSQAYAGQVIEAFSGFVVRGDLIVGGVMFGIITIVQFVVIARGAERVAEVGARFALDGLPGHQAAIDADLRAGVISPREASRRRAQLAERSNFYGAMDGTIRFVRGDAIAGLAITAINLLGGVTVGVVRHGLGGVQSLEVYGRLTIGDGLLSQLPALLVSLAAGFLVARVDRWEDKARRRLSDLWLQPSMLLVPAVMLLGLAVIPDMPRLAFVVTGVGLLGLSLVLAHRLAAERETRLVVDQGSNVAVRLHPLDVEEPRVLERALAEVRIQCSVGLGIEVPPIRLWLDAAASRGAMEVLIDGRSYGRTGVPQGSSGEDRIVISTFRVVMERARTLVDLETVDRMIESVRETHPIIVRQALERVALTDVLTVVRGFLEERVPLPPMRFVLSAMAEEPRFGDPNERVVFPEIARDVLVDHWVHRVIDGVRTLGEPRFLRLSPDAEEDLLSFFVRRDGVATLAMSESLRQRWLEDLGLHGQQESMAPLILVASSEARRAVALLVWGVTPHVPVLSTREYRASGEAVPAPAWFEAPDS